MSLSAVRKFQSTGVFAVAILAIFLFTCAAHAAIEMPIVLNSATQRYAEIDGNRVVWSDNRNGNYDIYMYDLSTNTETQITSDSVNQTHPDISDDRIVWLNWTSGGSVNVRMYNIQTGTEAPVPFSGISTVFSPDNANTEFFPRISGNRIVWDGSSNRNVILGYDILTGSVTEIAPPNGFTRKLHPDISGNRVVWEDWRSGYSEIYMYDFLANTETRISSNTNNTKDDPRQAYPAIDGDKIVWMDNRNPNRAYDVYMFDLLTQTESRISTDTVSNAFYPGISGDKIVWWSTAPVLSSGIYLYDLVTQTQGRISQNSSNIQGPGSSAVSNGKVVWTDNRNGNPDIYLYDLNPNVGPTAQIGAIPVTTLGHATNFDGSGSTDSDGTITNYSWDFGDGANADGVIVDHVYSSAGVYQVTLTVTDDDGATGTAMTSILVNTPPVAAISPVATVTFGQTTVFDGSASSDSDGAVTSYAWDFGDGLGGSGDIVNHTYSTSGTYLVMLTVTDNHGATGTATVSARVNALPLASITPIQTVIVGEATVLNASGSSDPDGTIMSYVWDFDDGSTGSGATMNHTYVAAGTYQAILTVTDNDGATATAVGSAVVQTPAQAIDDLIDLVQNMNLAQGIANSLDSKLQNASDALSAMNAGSTNSAISKLQAFINVVQAQSGNQLTVRQADDLIAAANRIIAAIN